MFELARAHTKKALDFIGKKLQIDIVYFVKGGFWLNSANFLAGLVSFFIVIAFSRLTSKEVYGQYQFILAVVAMLMIFSLSGMRTAILEAVARNKDFALVQATRARFKSSLIGSIVLLALSAYLKYVRNSDIWLLFVVVAAFYPFFYSFDLHSFFWIAKQKFERASMYTAISLIIPNSLILITLFITKSLAVAIMVFFASSSIIHFLLYKSICRTNLKGKDDNVVHYGIHLSLMQSFQLIAVNIDKLIISYFLGFEQLAIYGIAVAIPNGISGLVKQSSFVLIPKFSSVKGSLYSFTKNKLFLIFVLSIIISLLGIILSPFFIPLMFTAKYESSVIFAQVLFASILLVPLGRTFISMLQIRKKVNQLYKYQIFSSLIGTILLLLLVPKYGVLGACIAKIVANYCDTIQLWYFARSC